MGRAEDIYKGIEASGVNAIKEFVASRQAEELFLDFKRSADDGMGKKLHDNDRNNLIKAISGFGNSAGGVIVWGVDCSRDMDGADVARAIQPIKNVKRFVSLIQAALSGCTLPPHPTISVHGVEINEAGEGFVAVLIPRSDFAPHQTIGDYRYYMRSGSSFTPVLHDVLAGMFGRRPQPNVWHQFNCAPCKIVEDRLILKIGFIMRNNGPGVAENMFFNIWAWECPGDATDIGFDPPNLNRWDGSVFVGRHFSAISKAGVRMPPESFDQPWIMTLSLKPPFTKGFTAKGICGCGGSPPYRFQIGTTKEVLEEVYRSIMDGTPKTKDQLFVAAKRIMNVDIEKEEEGSFPPHHYEDPLIPE
jgi:hypothetical protein